MDPLEVVDRPPARGIGALADRLGVTPATIVVGVAAVAGAALAAWFALRAPDPPAPETVLPMAGAVEVPLPSTTVSPAAPLLVHVDGAVHHPGVHELAAGARVTDAIAAAGGLRDDADRRRVNLAAPLVDGERVWVPAEGEDAPPPVVAGAGGGGGSGPGEPSTTAPVRINDADATALEALPGIGPTLAAAIVDHRAREGPFRSVDGLLAVPGIGPATLDRLRPLVTVS